MPASQPATFNLQEFTDVGQLLVGGRLYTYGYGTTAQKTAFTDPDGTVPHTYTPDGAGGQYIALNARGELPAPLYLGSGSYDLALKRADGSTVWTRKADGVDNAANEGKAALMAASGAALVGFSQSDANAVATTIAEIFARRVSVWDFMTDAQRADALSGAPVLDHSDAWNRAITSLGGAGRVDVPRKRTAVYRLAGTVNVGSSNVVDSRIIIDIEPGTIMLAALPAIDSVLFSFKNVPGHFNNQGIKNLHVASTNGKGAAIKFSGQCFGTFENLYVEGFNVGAFSSNAGEHIFNEFIRFQNAEFHLNNTGILMDIDGGTDTSMHGFAFRNTTVNVGDGQTGYQNVNACWYNGDADIKFFTQSDSGPIIKMTTDGNTFNKGVFISGSLSCEGPAKVVGVGRFYLRGFANFDVGLTDTLVSPDPWEQGLMADNYIRAVSYGSSGMTVAELAPKSGEYGGIGPVGSLARLRKNGVEGIVANCYDAHAATPGNMFYTGFTGYQKNFDQGYLGHGLSSDGTEFTTLAPITTQCRFTHNNKYILRFDGQTRPNNTEGFWLGSGGVAIYSGTGSPEGVITAGQGSQFHRRDETGGSLTYEKRTGSGNTGWVLTS